MRYIPAPWLLTKKPNARLIAAAPDLLAALSLAVDDYDCALAGDSRANSKVTPNWVNAARAAIAKAVQS